MKAMVKRIIPKDMAGPKFPCPVSSTIAVVSTLDLNRMFPPASITAPTSDIAAPKAAITEAMIPSFASLKIIIVH